jgi:hypothetical protein
MVEKTRERATNEDKIDFCINASEFTDITLTDEESENLIRLMEREPNEKAKLFSEEALRYYNDMLIKNKEYYKEK